MLRGFLRTRPIWLSGRLFARFPLRRQDLHRAAHPLHRGNGRFGRPEDRYRDFGLDFAIAEEPNAVLRPAQDAGLDQRRGVDLAGRIEATGVDRGLQLAEVYLVELAGKFHVLEAAFRQPAVQRHLAAFKPLDAHARARGLALAAAAGGLALARADAAADALSRLASAGAAGEFVQFHDAYFSTTSMRCATLAIMPRVCGESTNSATRPILLSLRPTSVSRWR